VYLCVVCGRDEDQVQEEFATLQAITSHHLDLLDYRRTELQDHYVDLGGDLKVFFTVLLASRQDPAHTFSASPPSLASAQLRSEEDKEEEEEEEEALSGASCAGKRALDFVPASLQGVEAPSLPEGFEEALKVLHWAVTPRQERGTVSATKSRSPLPACSLHIVAVSHV
jgi:hypothetical protein